MKDLVDLALLELVEFDKNVHNCLSDLHFLKEYRTISLSLPRQCGKTTKLFDKTDEETLLLLHHSAYRNLHTIVRNFNNIVNSNLLNSSILIPRNFSKVKRYYKCMLIDEPSLLDNNQKENIDRLLTYLFDTNQIDSDFYVLKLGTDY